LLEVRSGVGETESDEGERGSIGRRRKRRRRRKKKGEMISSSSSRWRSRDERERGKEK